MTSTKISAWSCRMPFSGRFARRATNRFRSGLRLCPLSRCCGGVSVERCCSAAAAAGLRKASAFGDTAFLREKAVRKRARGRRPLTPELRQSNYRSAAVCKCTGAAQPRLLPLSIWCASCGRCRSAAGLRRRFIPSPLGKPARLYKIRSPAAASRRSTAHTAHRLSYPRHTFSFCTAQHNAHNQVPYTAPTISHSAAEKICSPHSPCTFLRFSISVIVTITLRLWKVNLSFVKMFASC